MSRIFVTGIGVISAVGNNLEENRTSLINQQSGIRKINEHFPSRFAGVLPFGEVKLETAEIQKKLHAYEPGVSRTSLLAAHAFEECITDSELPSDIVQALDTAVISGTTVGGISLTDELYHDANKQEDGTEYLSSYDCASVSLYLQKRYQLNGIINTINTACSSSANSIMYGTRLIKSGRARRAIVGGADSIAKFTINGFNSLFILSPENCRPFDAGRRGLNLGEGAAYLVLEREEDCADKRKYAEVTGYGNSNDAYHPSSLSENGDGPFLSMQAALQIAGLKPENVDYINAHGTATENNDEVESKAMLRLFGKAPMFSSTKSSTGHTLGASGAVEAVFSILSLANQEVYPSINFEAPIESTGLIPVLNYSKNKINHVMSNSFGFAGNCTSLVFSNAS